MPPSGEHLVEAQDVTPMRTMRVTIAPGQVAPVEYAAPADGVNGPVLEWRGKATLRPSRD